MTNTNADQNQNAARADNQARREARQAEFEQREANLRAERDERTRIAYEKMQADAKLKPTPTPDEILKAQSGQAVDEKEPDGSPEQNPYHPVVGPAAQIEVGRRIEPARSASDQANRGQQQQQQQQQRNVETKPATATGQVSADKK